MVASGALVVDSSDSLPDSGNLVVGNGSLFSTVTPAASAASAQPATAQPANVVAAAKKETAGSASARLAPPNAVAIPTNITASLGATPIPLPMGLASESASKDPTPRRSAALRAAIAEFKPDISNIVRLPDVAAFLFGSADIARQVASAASGWWQMAQSPADDLKQRDDSLFARDMFFASFAG